VVELWRYLEISRRWWWLVGVALLATTAVTVASVASETPTYESSATFLVRPRTDDASQDARAFDPLVRGVTINTTYASIARSDLIRDRAERQLDPAARADEMSVSAKVLTDTNIVSVSVRGSHPDHVLALATAISAETVEYVNGLSDVYVLQSVDEPTRAERPLATNTLLTISIGVVLGLTLGVGMALLGDYLRNLRATQGSRGGTASRRRTPPPRDARSPTGPATTAPETITCKRCSDTFERTSKRGRAPEHCDPCKLVRKKERLNQLAVNAGRKPPYPDPADGKPFRKPTPRPRTPEEVGAERLRDGAHGITVGNATTSSDGNTVIIRIEPAWLSSPEMHAELIANDLLRGDGVGAEGLLHAGPAVSRDGSNGEPDRP
jgi:capsular polysaccharide biosynthesis protein